MPHDFRKVNGKPREIPRHFNVIATVQGGKNAGTKYGHLNVEQNSMNIVELVNYNCAQKRQKIDPRISYLNEYRRSIQ